MPVHAFFTSLFDVLKFKSNILIAMQYQRIGNKNEALNVRGFVGTSEDFATRGFLISSV